MGRRRGKGRRGRESNTPSFWLLVAALKKFVVSNCACVFVCVWGGGVHAKGLGGAGRGGGGYGGELKKPVPCNMFQQRKNYL